MPLTHRSGLDCSDKSRQTIGVAIRVLLIFTLAVLAFFLLAVPGHPVHASGGSLSLGTIQLSNPSFTCQGSGWYVYVDGNNQSHSMNCSNATVQNCANTQNLGITFGYLSPSGFISGPVNGVIVYLDGGDGTNPAGESDELDMLDYYFKMGYEIVQLEWSSAWEATYNPFGSSPGNIQNAACRPATFLQYVHDAIYVPITQGTNGNSKAGMCAQGFSFGSAAIAYSLAYYGASGYLDNVELISGPPASDVSQGCQESPASPITVCPAGQYGCQLGGGSPWTLPPTYVKGDNYAVGSWTNDRSCGIPGTVSTCMEKSQWLNQSIVDQPPGTCSPAGATPTFNYSTTAMGAWLCRSLMNQQSDCSGSNFNRQYCPNNTSPQGEIFYQQFASSQKVFNVYAVDLCNGPEGVPLGIVPALSSGDFVASGQSSIQIDMAGTTSPALPGHCTHPAPNQP